MVVGRCNFNHVGADQIQTHKATEYLEQFATRHAACLRCAGARRVRRIHDVDVHRDVERCVANPLMDAPDDPGNADVVQVVRRDDFETKVRISLEVLPVVDWTTGAHVDRSVGRQQPLLERAPEWCSMCEASAEVRVPGIEMRIEVQHGESGVLCFRSSQERERDGVVPSQCNQVPAALKQIRRRGFDLPDGLLDIERVACDVTCVDHLLPAKWLGVEAGIVGPQKSGRLADRGWAKPRAGAV